MNKTYDYDRLGNITQKSDVGSYTYGSCNAGPHAVCETGSNSYTYDANGNMLTGGDKAVTYTPFNKLQHISENGTTVSWVYDANNNRASQTTINGTTRTTDYVGMTGTGNPLYEKTTQGTDITHKHYIYCGRGSGGSGAYHLQYPER